MSEHTPGPWRPDFGEAATVRDSDGGSVCTINWLRGKFGSKGRRTNEEGYANSILIAAAPDMLEALWLIAGNGNATGRNPQTLCDIALAAIAKATETNG